MCRAKCERGDSGCHESSAPSLASAVWKLSQPWPFGLLWYVTDEIMSPLTLQWRSPSQRLGNRGLALVILVTSPILQLPQTCQPTKIWSFDEAARDGRDGGREKQEGHGLF